MLDLVRTRLVGAALAATGLLALGCGDDGPAGPDHPQAPPAIQAEIDALVPEGALRDDVTEAVVAILDAGDDEAIDGLIDLVLLLADALADGDLAGGGADVSELADQVAEAAGLPAPGIPEPALGGAGTVAAVGPAGGTVTTPTRTAGVAFPAGAVERRTLVSFARLPEVGQPADRDGPLPTTLDQYPLFYDIAIWPEAELQVEGVVGICVVDPPDPFAPDPGIAPRLRLAHPDPANPSTIEILPLAEAPFLDCSEASTEGLVPANPARLGASISSFSPYGAVDPASEGGTAPSITSLEVHDPVSTAPGDHPLMTVGFADAEGDVALWIFEETSDPDDVFAATPVDPGVQGLTSGTFQILATCASSSPCNSGTVEGRVRLEDSAGNRSQPVDVSITFEESTGGDAAPAAASGVVAGRAGP